MRIGEPGTGTRVEPPRPTPLVGIVITIANIVGFTPLVLLLAFVLVAGGESGAEIIVAAFAPLLLLVPLVLILDLVFAVRALRRGSHGARRVGAIAVLVFGGAWLGLIGSSIVSSVRDHYERTRPLSLSEARALVADCNVRSIIRNEDSTGISLRRADDGWWNKDTASENFDALVRAARSARDRCGTVSTVDTTSPFYR